MSTLYVLKAGQKRGPFTTEELESHVVAGEFSPDDLYWTEGMEGWLPLSGIIQIETEASEAETAPVLEAGEGPPIDEDAAVLYEAPGIRVSISQVVLPEMVIPILGVARVTPQIEHIHRFRPAAGCVVLGVILVCVALLDIPKTTATHWTIWGAVLLGLALWMIRCAYAAFREPRSLLVIDMTDGEEHIERLPSEVVKHSAEAILQARKLLHQEEAPAEAEAA